MTTIYKELSEERKELQSKGELPLWFTTHGWQTFKSGYLHEAIGYKDTCWRIASTLAQHTDHPNHWVLEFFNILWNGWLSPSTPVLSNTGTKKGCPVSCSGTYIGDSVHDFYDSYKEIAILTKQGFGTSAYLGDIRSLGSKISSTGHKASGIVPVARNCINVVRDINQGTRRGSTALYIEPEHNDFDDLISYLNNNPDDCNIGWNITDNFINQLNQGNKEYITKWQKIMKTRMILGKGYLNFIDKVNRLKPKVYYNHNLKIKASNLCVHGDTLILTKEYGNVSIKKIIGKKCHAWNGEEWSLVTPFQTNTNQELYEIEFSNGSKIQCTEYHKFPISMQEMNFSGSNSRKTKYNFKLIETKKLNVNDKLIYFNLPFDENKKEDYNELSYWQGAFTADGCTPKNYSHLKNKIMYFYDKKMEQSIRFEQFLINENIKYTKIYQENQNRIVFRFKDHRFIKYKINKDNFINWMSGLIDFDGTKLFNSANNKKTGAITLQLSSSNYKMVQEIHNLLTEYGIYTTVNNTKKAGYNKLPDGNGNLKEYWTKASFRFNISCNELKKLLKLGLKTFRIDLSNIINFGNREAKRRIYIKSIKKIEGLHDIYCVTEPKRNLVIFNNVISSQCNEIHLPSSQQESFICVLSSLNLSKYDEWKDTNTVENSIYFLWCVNQEFIRLGNQIPGIERAVRFAENHQALGLGALGFHTYLQRKKIAFESFQAHMLNNQIFQYINKKANAMNEKIAKVHGECKYTLGTGKACTTLMAIAPNMTSAILAGGVSQGIEPIYENAYIQGSSAGELNRINPIFLQFLKEKGKYDETLIANIIQNHQGSVQNLTFLTEDEKQVFKTAFEIDQKSILRLASQRQRFIDQGQSLNLFFSDKEDEEYISEIHQRAALDPYIKGLYYARSKAGVQASKNTCIACEG